MARHLDETGQPKKEYSTLSDILHHFMTYSGGRAEIGGPYYTGAYHYGNEPYIEEGLISKGSYLYAGDNADSTRNLVDLYLGRDTIGFEKLRTEPYIINGDTIDTDVFKGKILPTKLDKTSYRLSPKRKAEFDNYIAKDSSFLINANDYTRRPDVYGNQTLDNTRHVVVTPMKDKKGRYSMKLTKYWDFSGSGSGGKVLDFLSKKQGGKPFLLEQIVPVTFDKEYTPEEYDFNRAIEKVGEKKYGGCVPRRRLATGGSIHIKPENRGKFTATMKRTSKSAEELSHSKNPLTRKRAIFALNARKWKH